MRAVFSLVLVVGIGLAAVAVYMAKNVFAQNQVALANAQALRAQIVETVPVFVVKEGVRYGSIITKDNVLSVKWPKAAVPPGAFTSIEALFPEGEDEFRTVLRAMEQNEPVLAVKVTAPGADAGVASRIGNGMRAFAIRVDVTSGVSGFLTPGDRVDVYWTGRAGQAEGGSQDVTKLILPNMKIFAIDQIADLERNSPTVARTVTLEATPEQVAALAQATATGRMTLSLVGYSDDTVAENIEVNQDTLLGIERQVAAPRAAPEICTVRTRKGADIIETPIPCPTN